MLLLNCIAYIIGTKKKDETIIAGLLFTSSLISFLPAFIDESLKQSTILFGLILSAVGISIQIITIKILWSKQRTGNKYLEN